MARRGKGERLVASERAGGSVVETGCGGGESSLLCLPVGVCGVCSAEQDAVRRARKGFGAFRIRLLAFLAVRGGVSVFHSIWPFL